MYTQFTQIIKYFNRQFIERDVFPEKHFEQVSVNNDFFSGVMKWEPNRKLSWENPEVDQWRFELRFDEVIAEYMYVKLNRIRYLVFPPSKMRSRKAIWQWKID